MPIAPPNAVRNTDERSKGPASQSIDGRYPPITDPSVIEI